MNKDEIAGLVEPSDWEQGNWPEATEHYVRGLERALTTLSARVETLEAEVAQAAKAEREKLREALELADAALSGANMNMNVVKRKIREALQETSQ